LEKRTGKVPTLGKRLAEGDSNFDDRAFGGRRNEVSVNGLVIDHHEHEATKWQSVRISILLDAPNKKAFPKGTLFC